MSEEVAAAPVEGEDAEKRKYHPINIKIYCLSISILPITGFIILILILSI